MRSTLENQNELEAAADSFLDRLKNEISELSEKTNKLENFIASNIFNDIEDEIQRWLLVRQFSSMCDYKAILEKRLELLSEDR